MRKLDRIDGDCGIPARSKPSALTLILLTATCLALTSSGLFAAGPKYEFQVVTYLGDAAPGGGVFTNDFEPSALNNRGELLFTAEPDKPGSEGIFLAYHGELSQI